MQSFYVSSNDRAKKFHLHNVCIFFSVAKSSASLQLRLAEVMFVQLYYSFTDKWFCILNDIYT